MLARRGYTNITVYDRLGPPPPPDSSEFGNPDRSYSLGIGARGQLALERFGVLEGVLRRCVPVRGYHTWEGESMDRKESPEVGTRSHTTMVLQRDRLDSCLLEAIEASPQLRSAITVHHWVECLNMELPTKPADASTARKLTRLTMAPVSDEKWQRIESGAPPVASSSDADASNGLASSAAGGATSQPEPFTVEAEFVVGTEGFNSSLARSLQSDPEAAANRFKVTLIPDRNKIIYKTIPLYPPKEWRSDFGITCMRRDVGLTLTALPSKVEDDWQDGGAGSRTRCGMVGLLLFKPDSPIIAAVNTPEQAKELFQKYFPGLWATGTIRDADLPHFVTRRPSNLPVFSYCGPVLHHQTGRFVLLGDAIHTVKPYYGLGLNSAFEDVSVLATCLDATGDDLAGALPLYSQRRAKEAKTLVTIHHGLDGQLLSFVLPLIADRLTYTAFPKLFHPNTIRMLQMAEYSFTQAAALKWRDRVLQCIMGSTILAVVATVVTHLVKHLLIPLAQAAVATLNRKAMTLGAA
eukprot:jgi/Mesvir1/15442/Mv06625-RA.1